MDVLGSVKGRGTSGLDQQQLLELTAAIELLEQDGGVSGEKLKSSTTAAALAADWVHQGWLQSDIAGCM